MLPIFLINHQLYRHDSRHVIHILGDNLSHEKNSPAFYLDAFPEQVLGNVLRVRNWVPHIPLESIIELYDVNGESGRFMKPRFNALCISDVFKAKDEIEGNRWEKQNDPILWTNGR